MKQQPYIFFLLLVLVSCSKTKHLEGHSSPKVFIVKNLHLEKKSKDCEGCCSLVLDYFEVTKGPSPLKDSVNSSVQQFFKSHLYAGKTLGEAADHFIGECKSEQADYPAPWSFNGESKVTFLGKGFLTVAFTFSQYSGGAHGIDELHYIVYDLKTGRALRPVDFILDMPRLRDKAEEIFRKNIGVDSNADLQELGYNEKHLVLNANMGFVRGGLAIHYNPYEIASYAQGPTDILVPWDWVGSILRK